jgi:glutathionylspermidine synthase/DNA gyrase inhibitor GyrI
MSFHTVDGQPYWNEAAAYRFEPEEIEALEAATNELHALCLSAVDKVIQSKKLDRLGISDSAHAVITQSWERKQQGIYGRFDLAYDGQNPPKLLEYNADTPTSLLEAAVIQWHWLQEVEPKADQFNSMWEGLIDTWRILSRNGSLKGQKLHFASVNAAEDLMTTAVLMDTAQEAGLEVSFLDMGQIGWDHRLERFVDRELKPIDVLFKLYPWEWVLSDTFGPLALSSYDETQWIEPIWKMVLSNKAILAVLWEMFPDHPNLLPAYLDGPHDLTEYVRKPILGREGANVSIFLDGEELNNAGPYEKGPYVYQGYAPLANFDGNHAVIGSWVIGGVARGIGVRESDGPITEDLARFVPHYFWPNYSINETMNVQLVQMSALRIVMIRHIGPYELISPVFDRLCNWATSQGVPVQRIIGIYWDNPDFTPSARLRSAACVQVPINYQITNNMGLPLELSQIAGGPYATTTFVGPYENLAPVWTNFTNYIERSLRRQISQNPAFEVYVNDASTTPPQQLVTELYMPVI